MPYRRTPARLITPISEDIGLFKSPVRQVTLGLVPGVVRNNRQDFVVRGFADPEVDVFVTFAGRRVKQVPFLEARLRKLLFQAKAQAQKWDQAALDATRLTVSVEGAWRPRFQRDTTGWETRSYHLMAARWSFTDEAGAKHQFGEGVHRPEVANVAPP